VAALKPKNQKTSLFDIRIGSRHLKAQHYAVRQQEWPDAPDVRVPLEPTGRGRSRTRRDASADILLEAPAPTPPEVCTALDQMGGASPAAPLKALPPSPVAKDFEALNQLDGAAGDSEPSSSPTLLSQGNDAGGRYECPPENFPIKMPFVGNCGSRETAFTIDHIKAPKLTGVVKCLGGRDGQSSDLSLSVNSAVSDASGALKRRNVFADLQLISPVLSSSLSSVGLDFFNNRPSSPPDPVPLVSFGGQTGPQTLGAPINVRPESALPAKTGPKALRWEEALLSGITPRCPSLMPELRSISACVFSRPTLDELDMHQRRGDFGARGHWIGPEYGKILWIFVLVVYCITAHHSYAAFSTAWEG